MTQHHVETMIASGERGRVFFTIPFSVRLCTYTRVRAFDAAL
jgi:hypothetical protein